MAKSRIKKIPDHANEDNDFGGFGPPDTLVNRVASFERKNSEQVAAEAEYLMGMSIKGVEMLYIHLAGVVGAALHLLSKEDSDLLVEKFCTAFGFVQSISAVANDEEELTTMDGLREIGKEVIEVILPRLRAEKKAAIDAKPSKPG